MFAKNGDSARRIVASEAICCRLLAWFTVARWRLARTGGAARLRFRPIDGPDFDAVLQDVRRLVRLRRKGAGDGVTVTSTEHAQPVWRYRGSSTIPQVSLILDSSPESERMRQLFDRFAIPHVLGYSPELDPDRPTVFIPDEGFGAVFRGPREIEMYFLSRFEFDPPRDLAF